MFEFPVENRFESSQICSKIGPKSDQNGGLGRVWNRMGTRIDPEPQKVKKTHSILEVILGVILAPKIW